MAKVNIKLNGIEAKGVEAEVISINVGKGIKPPAGAFGNGIDFNTKNPKYYMIYNVRYMKDGHVLRLPGIERIECTCRRNSSFDFAEKDLVKKEFIIVK